MMKLKGFSALEVLLLIAVIVFIVIKFKSVVEEKSPQKYCENLSDTNCIVPHKDYKTRDPHFKGEGLEAPKE